MATFDYSGIYSTASSLITKFGDSFTQKQIDTSYTESYNPVTGSMEWTNGSETLTEAPYTSVTADGVVTGYTSEERYNTTIEVGDKKLLTVTANAPKSGDIYTVGSVDYSYVDHETIQPASSVDPLLYKIQIRV
jgi:D-alanyl-D-alanine carboxypeptidase